MARPRRPLARPGVLAAVAIIVVIAIVAFVLDQQITTASPSPQAGPSSSAAVARALVALLRQGTPDTAAGYWEKPSAALEAATAGAGDAGSARSARCS